MKMLNGFKNIFKKVLIERVNKSNPKKISVVHFLAYLIGMAVLSSLLVAFFEGSLTGLILVLILSILSSLGLTYLTQNNFKKEMISLLDVEINSVKQFGDLFTNVFLLNENTTMYHDFFKVDPYRLRKILMSKEDLDAMVDLIIERVGVENFEKIMKSKSMKRMIQEDGGVSYYSICAMMNELEREINKKTADNNVELLVDKLSTKSTHNEKSETLVKNGGGYENN